MRAGLVFCSAFSIMLLSCNPWPNDNPLDRLNEHITATSTVIAGGTAGTADGVGTAAHFSLPTGICSDGTYLYVTDAANVRKVVIADGTTTTIAADFLLPHGIAIVGGNLYVADTGHNNLRVVDIASGAVGILAGSSSGDFGYTDGTGTAALLNHPMGICVEGVYLYVADQGNNRIRRIAIADGTVSTFAGSGVAGSSDGTGTSAQFTNPAGIASDGTRLLVYTLGPNYRVVDLATKAVTTLNNAWNNAGGMTAPAYLGSEQYCTFDGDWSLRIYEWPSWTYIDIHPDPGVICSDICVVGRTVYATDYYKFNIVKIDLPQTR